MNKSLVFVSGLDHVVPLIAVESGWRQVDSVSSASDTFLPVSYGVESRAASTRSPAAVVVFAMRLTITSRLTSGRPRQCSVIWHNSRCSIVCHLLVPGGK